MDEARPTMMDTWERLGADRDRWRTRARWWRALYQRARHDEEQRQTTFAGRVLIQRDEARAQRDSLSDALARTKDNNQALNELLHQTRLERDQLRAGHVDSRRAMEAGPDETADDRARRYIEYIRRADVDDGEDITVVVARALLGVTDELHRGARETAALLRAANARADKAEWKLSELYQLINDSVAAVLDAAGPDDQTPAVQRLRQLGEGP